MIWGNQKSYLMDGVTVISLDKSQTSMDFFQNQDVEHRSILNGVITHSAKGDYSEFTVTERLWQEANPKAKLNAILACVGRTISFYLYGSSIVANCFVNYVRPFYMKNLINYDACVIFLEPLTYLSISPGYIADDTTGLPILDDSGIQIFGDGITI